MSVLIINEQNYENVLVILGVKGFATNKSFTIFALAKSETNLEVWVSG